MPGYDLKVDGDYARLDSLQCTYCKLILRDAIQTSEGQRFCKTCWEQIEKSPDLIDNKELEIDFSEEIHPDIAVRKEVYRLPVKCYNVDNGCPWTGSLKDHEEDHKGKCIHKTVPCPLGCNRKIPVGRVQEHTNTECPCREIQCNYCKTKMSASQYENHQFNCTHAPYSCGQCGANMVRSKMEQHLLLDCTVATKCCGCNEYINRNAAKQPNIQTHLRDAVEVLTHFQHLGFQLRTIRTQFSEDLNHIRSDIQGGAHSINELKTALTDVRKHLQEQRKANDHKDQEIADLRRTIRQLEERIEKNERSQPPSLATQSGNISGNYFSSNQATYEDQPPSNDRLAQLDTKIAEQERTSGMLKVHISELELQLQASLASTYNGSFLWRIPDVRRRKRDAIDGKITSIYSPPFYTGRNGYKMCIRAYLNGDGIGYNTHVSIFFVLMKGEYDPLLKWPFDYKVSLILVDQDHKRHIVQTFKPSPSSSSFQRPKTDMNIASGCPKFAELKILDNDSYVKEEVMYIKAIVDTTRIFHP